MWPHFVNLLAHSWARVLSALGTTTLAIVLFSFAVPVVTFIVTMFAVGKSHPGGGVTGHLKQTVRPTLIGLLVPLLFIAFVFAWCVVTTVYNDHQSSVATKQKLLTDKQTSDNRLNQLRQQLSDICYRAGRHYTKAQYNAINSSLSDLAVKYKHPRIDFGMFWCAWKGSTCDYEAHDFMGATQDLFKKSGWDFPMAPHEVKIPIIAGDKQPPGATEGFSITIETDVDSEQRKQDNEIANEIRAIFVNAGVKMDETPIGSRGVVNEHHSPPLIFVGTRPPDQQ